MKLTRELRKGNGMPEKIERSYEERANLFKAEQEKLLEKYGLVFVVQPAIKPVAFGDGVIFSLDAQIMVIDKK